MEETPKELNDLIKYAEAERNLIAKIKALSIKDKKCDNSKPCGPIMYDISCDVMNVSQVMKICGDCHEVNCISVRRCEISVNMDNQWRVIGVDIDSSGCTQSGFFGRTLCRVYNFLAKWF